MGTDLREGREPESARTQGWLRRALARVAGAAPARVFAVEGTAPPEPTSLLRLAGGVQLVDSPRAASILLVAGEVPPPLADAVRRVHDAMATPRGTVIWRRDAPADPFSLTGSATVVASTLARIQAGLFGGALSSEPPLLPDVEPAEWRGIGPFGQGGSGMTGGVPYGRPMAETAPDRDGLRLDRLDVRIGPFFPPFPPGLTLVLGVQGDVVQQVSVGDNPFTGVQAASDDVFRRANRESVSIAALEMARARHHLRWLAHALRVHGLSALGLRALALSERITPGAAASVADLRRLLERTRALAGATVGVGIVAAEFVSGRGLGPVSRASGVAADLRADDEAYKSLGFEPVTQTAGDARARWRQRLAEAEQSVTLADRAGETRTGGTGRVEAPRGVLTPTSSPLSGLLELLPELLPGREWGDAVTTVVSLDLDLRELPETNDTPSHEGAS